MNEIEKRFQLIFNNKGNIGPIAEKSRRNFEIINKNETSKTGRVFHFCVGHAFSNIDKSIFEFKIDETKEELKPTKFKTLQKENFTIEIELYKLIEDIRNCNSHYIHTFDKLALSNIDEKLLSFIKDAFKFSATMIYLRERNLSYSEFKEKNSTKNLVKYLCNKFYPNEEYQKEIRVAFLELKLDDALDELLFIRVDADFEWKVQKDYSVFTIKKDSYLSSFAQLFILGLFLYKNEAEQLISKIKGFKRNDDKFHFKRDLFTFFSKKFTSQDIHSEEKHLIRFRDIIQYLNHYPTIWNKHLEPERLNTSMTNELEKYVIESEIFRSFPKLSESKKRESFLAYSTDILFPNRKNLFNLGNNLISDNDKNEFEYEINNSPEIKDIDENIKALKKINSSYNHKEIRQLEWKRKELKSSQNPIKEKLVQRIKEDKLLKSYGRNQDRFMKIAIRFLAEENYFGKDAKFKLYRFYTTDEQNQFIEREKEVKSKKEIDNFKYHQGKLVHYSTFEEHNVRYPDWDTPFVIENNSFQVIIKFPDKTEKLFSIQRNLMIYLLEVALFKKDEKLEDRGKELLTDYYFNSLMPDFEAKRSTLIENGITPLHRKLLPKRLLYKYQPAQINGNEEVKNPFEKIFEEANKQEERYNMLLLKAQKLEIDNEFLAKNKGKQFKLRFIRKAWHLMYFKESYQKQAEEFGHHKGFHITKEEFNNFSKWMYGFEEVPEYKDYLKKLFENKKFTENIDFAHLFDNGTSLDDLYHKSKALFKEWSQLSIDDLGNKKEVKIEQYQSILSKYIVYINISHFISFLENKGLLKRNGNSNIQYSSLDNVPYLINEYYYKELLPKDEYKENGKLFNKLKTIKLEDSLLYELAIRYLCIDKSIVNKAKSNVKEILNSEFTLDIKNVNNKHLYNLIVPFNKIESLAILIQHKTDQQIEAKNRKTSFLGNIDTFLRNSQSKSGEVKIIAQGFNSNNQLKFDDLNKINNHIISSSVKFSDIQMRLEEYFIVKERSLIKTDKNYIESNEIMNSIGKKVFDDYYQSNIRKKAFHFGVPEKEYEEVIKTMEKIFLKNEVSSLNTSSFEELDKYSKAVCRVFLRINHSNLFPRRSDSENKQSDFENIYYDTLIRPLK